MSTKLLRGYGATRVGQIHYARGGQGRDLLLIGGAGRSMSVFESLIPLLAPLYTVWTFDLPGSGGSDRLPDGAGFKDIAGAVVDLMDGLGIPSTSVYGLHTGNKIGAAMAAEWPSRVELFIFAGQSHSIIPDNKTRNQVIQAHMPAREGDAPVTSVLDWVELFRKVTSICWRVAAGYRPADPAARARVIAEICDEFQTYEAKSDLYQANYTYDLAGDLVRIKTPTLVLEIVNAMEDAEIGRQGADLVGLIPGAKELRTIREGNRFGVTLEDRAEEVAAIIRGFMA